MRLPNGEHAYIQSAKLGAYLLSLTHPKGMAKAKFLRGLGFNDSNVDLLEQGLLEIAHSIDVSQVVVTAHGTKYIIEGELLTPSGRVAQLITVWIIDAGQDRPRFVTAYPV
jgi:hypothetical protein